MRCQNTNRKSSSNDGASPPKRPKLRSTEQHNYASLSIPVEDDQEANKRNVSKLKQEVLKPKSQTEIIKVLIRRTFPIRRREILEDQPKVDILTEDFPHLKKTNLVCIAIAVR